jgi:predicted alpha/beta hydrolase family esterase
MEKKQVFYIHGGESYTDYNQFLKRLETKDIWDLPSAESHKKWTNTFAADLGDEYEVFMPVMPNKNNAKYNEWKIWFEKHFEYLRNDVIFSGCSLGAMFLVRYLIEHDLPMKAKAIILMACPVQEDGFADDDSGSFRFENNDLPKLGEKADQIIIMHSKDDFLVPYHHAEIIHGAIDNSELVTFEDKNHFLVEELPELVERIRAIK